MKPVKVSLMGRRRRSRGTSAGSVEQDVKNEPAKEVITRSGKHCMSSEGSPVKDQAKSPVLRSSSKRGSTEFDKPTPKRLSAYAQSLENKSNVSRESDTINVLVMGKSPPKKGSQKNTMQTEKLDSKKAGPAKIMQRSQGRRRSSGKQAAATGKQAAATGKQAAATGKKAAATGKQAVATDRQAAVVARSIGSDANLQKQGPRYSRKSDSKKPSTAQSSHVYPSEGSGPSGVIAGEKTMASKTAQKEVVEVVGKKNCMQRSGQGKDNTCSAAQQTASVTSTARDGHLPQASAVPKPPPCDQIDGTDVRLLPDFLADMDVAGTVPADTVLTSTDRGASVSTSSLSIFPLSNPDKVVMVLSHPQEVFLRGKAYVYSLQGHVVIHGFLVKPGGIPRPVYSPDCSNLLAVGTVQQEAPPGDSHDAIRTSLGNEDRDTVKRILQVVDDNSVVLVFKRLECHMCSYVSSIKPFTQLFSGSCDQSSVTPVGTLDLATVTNIPELYMRYDDDYRSVVHQYCDRVTGGFSPVVVVCGGKNVGKSTLTRYLINSVLNCCNKVAYLECDVGQTEFTPSGVPALCVITKPLLGPPFTHQRKPRRWSFFGGVSAGAQPKEYLQCLRYAYESYARMDQKPPLVVNTMGWTKGLGIGLMVETVRMVQPELIIQINSTRQTKNFPYITTEFVDNDPGFRWQNGQVRNDANKTEHHLVILNSPVSASLDGHEKYRPKDLRNLMLLAYFGQMQPVQGPLKDLAELQPYVVPWSAVGVHICSGAVANSQVMYVLNASVVALCITDEKTMLRSNDPHYPKFFNKTPVCQGVGFGIVRAINPEKKVFHILTPVPMGELRKVNCLLRGDLELPEQLLLQQRSEGLCPYIGSPSDVIGASSTKKRRHMFRQRRGNMR